MRCLPIALLALAACRPGGVGDTEKLCARAAAMYEKCESREGLHVQEWELGLDRWRGLCRAAFTGETRQLLPDGLRIWNEMSDAVRIELRRQAACAAEATACAEYTACDRS